MRLHSWWNGHKQLDARRNKTQKEPEPQSHQEESHHAMPRTAQQQHHAQQMGQEQFPMARWLR